MQTNTVAMVVLFLLSRHFPTLLHPRSETLGRGDYFVGQSRLRPVSQHDDEAAAVVEKAEGWLEAVTHQ